MSDILSYRDAVHDDLPAIVDIYNSTIAGRLVTADTELVSVADKQHWFNNHSTSRPIKMIERAGDLVGWISFNDFYGRPAYSGTAEISIYLKESERHKGYGNQILKTAIQWCAALHIHTLLAFIFSHNISSIKLFEKNNFQQWGHLKDIAVMENKRYSLVILGLPINQNSLASLEE